MGRRIEWTNRTWNPVRGCSMVSAGCQNCYAMQMANRFKGKGQPYRGLVELGPQGPRWNGKVRVVPKMLDQPLHWKKPQRVFVNSMGDLFHEDISWPFVLSVFTTMQKCPQHTFQILTKRPGHMLDMVQWMGRKFDEVHEAFPLPNVWLGASVEDQKTFDERVEVLGQVPAAVRFLSMEPLLEEIDIGNLFDPLPDGSPYKPIHWMIIGGESGRAARPCDIAWIRSIKNQCQAAKVPVFVKQLGANIAPLVVKGGSVKKRLFLKDRKGGDMAEWPKDLRVREFPTC